MDRDVQVTAADIARLGDVGRAAVSNWRRRHDDFPQPVGGTATSPAFSLGEIKEWLLGHSDGKPLPAREWLWQDLRAGVPEEELADLIADLGAFLVYLDREDDDWAALSATDDAAVAAVLPERVLAACAAPMQNPPPPKCLIRDRLPLLRRVAALATEDGAKETFTFLRERYFELHSKRMYATPEPVARLMAELCGPSPEIVLDPACGSGALLKALRDRPGNQVRHLLGQDADEATTRLTAAHLALHAATVRVSHGDSLRQNAFPGTRVDAVVCNPPFNDRAWGYEELTADPRWEYGLPPRMESELAWIQHALFQLKPGGTAVVLMPPAVAGRRSGRRIRAQLIRRGALKAVITLPLGSIPNMAVALALWVLRRPADSQTPDHVLMVDTSDRPEDFARVAAAAWARFEAGAGADEPGVSRAVPSIELLDDDVDLTPARYLAPPSADLSPERVTGQRNRVADFLRLAAELVPTVESAPEPKDLPMVPLAELLRRGMLTIHHQSPVRPGEPSEVADGLTVLTAEDVVDGTPPTATTPDVAVQHEIIVRPGDVLVPNIARRPVARVAGEGGPVLGLRLSLLRPDPALLDPHFVAGFLSGSVNLRNYVTVGSRAQVDVRRAELPPLPIEEQRGYGETFRKLAEFEASLRRVATLGEDLIQLISDGLTHGAVRPSTEDIKNTEHTENTENDVKEKP
ncbi:N-6 DNA methylase [Streptosporangium sp. NBC_01810]|uniref:N-6 DNA methylase n=1 Tax=Streptosporangium sp. NBC_01810 TaxID=2975951 RepID=UPI002DD8B2EC|nr:N-6 DNA methylase [Streptosporangium sp. NBC_01810]WSA27234.1 N-6 DNA methylase [Streptosporangium sp. NBC_01810]